MPANKKYLLQTRWGRASKVLAAIFGGLFATSAIHLFLAFYANTEVVVSTALFSTFIVWTLLMLMVYWIKKPWVSWAILTSITLVLGVGIYLAKTSM